MTPSLTSNCIAFPKIGIFAIYCKKVADLDPLVFCWTAIDVPNKTYIIAHDTRTVLHSLNGSSRKWHIFVPGLPDKCLQVTVIRRNALNANTSQIISKQNEFNKLHSKLPLRLVVPNKKL